MQLKMGGKGDKQSPVLVIVLIVLILGAGAFFAKNLLGGGSGGDLPAPGSTPMPMGGPPGPGEEMAGAPPGAGGPDGPGAPGAPAEPPPGTPPGAAPGPGPGPAPSGPAPSAPAPAASAPDPAPAPGPRPATAPRSASSGPEMQSIKVFGTVTVNFPKGWGIDLSSANTTAVFTNGKAFFEVHAPDPKAQTAKEIADKALGTVIRGANVSAQSASKIGGNDAYIYTANKGGTTIRLVGLDSPMRVVLVSYVKGGSYSAYQGTFDKMQESLGFGG